MSPELPPTDADATMPPSAPSELVTLPPPDSLRTLAPTSAMSVPPCGVLVPGYEVVRELGRGGMGVVYMARHQALGRVVALKMILSGSFAGADELVRFRAEAEAVARLQHPGIVQVFEVGSHDGLPYFALEFCSGVFIFIWALWLLTQMYRPMTTFQATIGPGFADPIATESSSACAS